MQFIFNTDYLAEDFSRKDSEIFPEAPMQCHFKDCSLPVKLKKHGYYSRYFLSKLFSGILYIRRYICPVCGRTISMIPMFCLQKFQYSGIDIISMLNEFYRSGISLKVFVEKLKKYFPSIERRHINYYRKRIINNRKLIQYGLNLISPGFIHMGLIPDNQNWIKDFLEQVDRLHPHVFLVDFFKNTGKSFLTSKNMIA